MYGPPTLRDLLSQPEYRAYFKKRPEEIQTTMTLHNPWQVWAYNGQTDRWGSRLCLHYPDAYGFVRELYRDPRYADLCIVSRSHIYSMPQHLKGLWDPYRFDWCGRCRRPTVFSYALQHRALKKAPTLTTDEPYRCFYCGARKVLSGGALD